MKKIFLIVAIFIFYAPISYAADSYFIDYSKVLNKSKAGASLQKNLKVKFESAVAKFAKEEIAIKKEESEIIAQKKILSSEDYKNKVTKLRQKVKDMQLRKQKSFNDIAKLRNTSKSALLTKISPILKKYMEDNSIRVILNKKSVVMADTNLEITDKLIAILNKELPSLKN
tara:strand:- start:4443 stop:4955 length:513 start_codon:yes stop_codon:yes gene_type:complete